MSFATFRRDVAECRAWEKRLHAGSTETRKAAALPGWPEWVVPLLLPLYGALAWKWGLQGSSFGWIAAFPMFSLLQRGRLFSPFLPTEWEAIALPSRRAWPLARWSHRLPALLWLGACLLGFLYLDAQRAETHPTSIRWPVAVVYLLSPLLLVVAAPWFSAKSRLFIVTRPITTLLTVVLAISFAAISGVLCIAMESISRRGVIFGLVFAGLAVLFFLAAVHLVRPRRQRNRESHGEVTWASSLGTTSLGTAGAVSLIALAVSMFLAEQCLFVSPAGEDGSLLPAWLVYPAVPLALLMAADTLRILPDVDLVDPLRTPARENWRRRESSAGLSKAGKRTGAGLRSAAWCLYRGRWRHLPHPWFQEPGWVLWECRALPYGFLAVSFLAWSHSRMASDPSIKGGILTLGCGSWFLLSASMLPSPLELPKSRRLHLMGTEFDDVVRHNRLWGLLLTVAPAFSGGLLVFLIPDSIHRFETPLLWSALLACTGSTLHYRCGNPAWTVRVLSRSGPALMWAVLGAAFLLWMASPRIALMVIGPAIFLLGLTSVISDVRDPTGAARRMAEEAEDD